VNTERFEAGLREHVFALGFVEGPYDDAILHARAIGADEIAAVSEADHPHVGKRLWPRELAEHAVILREPGFGTRASVENAYASIGLQIEAAMSASDTEAIKRMLNAEHSTAYISSLKREGRVTESRSRLAGSRRSSDRVAVADGVA
jgi:DNA-binding transcriptional LysR family regulator